MSWHVVKRECFTKTLNVESERNKCGLLAWNFCLEVSFHLPKQPPGNLFSQMSWPASMYLSQIWLMRRGPKWSFAHQSQDCWPLKHVQTAKAWNSELSVFMNGFFIKEITCKTGSFLQSIEHPSRKCQMGRCFLWTHKSRALLGRGEFHSHWQQYHVRRSCTHHLMSIGVEVESLEGSWQTGHWKFGLACGSWNRRAAFAQNPKCIYLQVFKCLGR